MNQSLFPVLFSQFAVVHPYQGNAAAGPGYAGQSIGHGKEQSEKGSKPEPQGKILGPAGYTDKQAGQYVPGGCRGLNRIASLNRSGFPTETIEKCQGQEVTVRGISSTNGTGPFSGSHGEHQSVRPARRNPQSINKVVHT